MATSSQKKRNPTRTPNGGTAEALPPQTLPSPTSAVESKSGLKKRDLSNRISIYNSPRKPEKDEIVIYQMKESVGLSEQEIASQMGMTIADVNEAVKTVRSRMLRVSDEIVQMHTKEVFVELQEQIKDATSEALRATKMTDAGEEIADHRVRLKAIETISKMVGESGKRAAAGVQINQQFNNQASDTGKSSFSFESVLRKVREEKGLSNNFGIPATLVHDAENSPIDDELLFEDDEDGEYIEDDEDEVDDEGTS